VTALPTGIENACWIVSTGFSTYSTNDLLFYLGGAFYSLTPLEGMALWVWDENCFYEFTGTTWQKRSHTAIPADGNWKVFYSNGSAVVTELAVGATATILRSTGPAAAPEFAVAETRLASVTVNLQNGDAKTNIYTVPTGKKLIVTRVIIRQPSGAMAGGTDFDLGSGTNADDWVTGVDLSGMGTGEYQMIRGGDPTVSAYDPNLKIFNAADVFGIKPVTGATADVTGVADLFGYLIDA
jgi:hypothetical protein